jgi:hypothetical protein
MLGQGLACQEVDLQRADDALAIAGLDARGRFAVHALQQAMQARHAAPLGNPVEPRTHRDIRAGAWKETAHQGAIVETGAADENRPMAACVDAVDRRHRVAHVACGSVFIGWLDDVDEVMRNPRRSDTGTLSVPISKPRYTAVESQLMTSPPCLSASSMPSALFPVAVGPRMARIGGRGDNGIAIFSIGKRQLRIRQSESYRNTSATTIPSRTIRPSCCERLGSVI